jgi:hypothetical protein
MVRRGLGRARVLVGIGAVIALVAMALPWVTIGEAPVILTPIVRNGFDGAGILVFVGGVLLLALIVLPYAATSGTSALDRPATYVALTGIALAGLLIELYTFLNQGHLGLPDRAPGLWLAAVGLFVVCWGVGELLSERPTVV